MQVAFQVSADFVSRANGKIPIQVQMEGQRNALGRLASHELVPIHGRTGNVTEIGNGAMK